MRTTEISNIKLILVNYLRCALLVLLLVSIQTSNAVTVEQIPNRKPVEIKLSSELGTVYTKQQIAELVNTYATRYRVSADKMMNTIECESHYKNVQSGLYHDNGVREDSWGVSQINLYWNRDVSLEEALDPYFSVEFMAKSFSEGKAGRWSCYRKLYQ